MGKMDSNNQGGLAVEAASMVTTPVLAVGLGRGSSGKSTGLAELVWRAQSQGRNVLVADGDVRSRTLTGMFPEASYPETEELPDVKAWLSGVLNRMVKEKRSAVLDLGGGDRVLLEYGRDLKLVEFCARRGIEPLAIYFLGPDKEDLAHVLSIYEAGYFRPKRSLLILNEGVIREGKTVAGAFERTINDAGFQKMLADGVQSFLLTRLACMDQVMGLNTGFYAAAVDDGDAALDPVEQFMVEEWLADLHAKREKKGVSRWLP